MDDEEHLRAERGTTDSEQAQNVPPADSARSARGEGAARGLPFDGDAVDLFLTSMEQTRMAVCLTDPYQPDNPIVFVNRAFLKLTGYEESEVLNRNCRFLQGPDSDPETVARMRRTIEDEDVAVLEVLNYRKDGSRFWNALHLGPIYDTDGRLRFHFGSQWDVTDVHAARSGEQQARLLSRELSHRMKNMFSVIGSVVLMTGRKHGAPEVAREINDRIRALGRAYETTLAEGTGRDVSLRALLEHVLGPYGLDETGRIAAEGPDAMLDPNAISTLGLVLHELATNAIKYGALSGPDEGRIAVSWQIDHGRGEGGDRRAELVLDWRESGGPPVGPPQDGGRGMGAGIVSRLLDMTGGSIRPDWDAEGLRAVLRLPTHP